MTEIYIRRNNNHGWVKGCSHHKNALMQFKNDELNPIISVPHEKGGLFKAYFKKNNDEVYQYIDEYGNTVEISLIEPDKVGFINRLTIF
jgi:hypothetical protein